MSESKIHELLEIIYPTSDKGKNNRTRIVEAGAITAYHQQTEFPVIPILLTGDAPKVSSYLLMNKLYAGSMTDETTRSCVLWRQCTAEKLDEFLGQYWDYYGKSIQFKETPNSEEAYVLSTGFDDLFSTKTGYPSLDDRIAKTVDKKSEHLMTLKHPEVPLHNNESELGARAQVRRRDVSLHTMTEDGTKANDTFLTIVEAAKKLDVLCV